MALIDKLTAIANAIRSKTGKSNALTLDEMPTEIASIGAGAQIASGAFSAGTNWYAENTVSVRGLPFSPTSLIAYATVSYGNNISEVDCNLLYAVELGSNGQHALISASDGTVYDDSLNDWFRININSDGFSIAIVDKYGADDYPNYIMGGEWRYIAVG